MFSMRQALVRVFGIAALAATYALGYPYVQSYVADWKQLLSAQAAEAKIEVDPALAPQALTVAAGVTFQTINYEGMGKRGANGLAFVGATFPAHVAHREGDDYYVCNYKDLYLVNLKTGRAWLVAAPEGLQSPWVPTAVAYDAVAHRIYLATYTGKNILVLDARERTAVRFERVIEHPELKGPEGVALTTDRKHLAVADYDGDSVELFTTEGELVWKQPVKNCHGVGVLHDRAGRDSVLISSTGESAVYKFDFAGRLLRRVSRAGWTGRDCYKYPTSVLVRGDGLIAVTDVFRGQVIFVDEELYQFGAVGGNGPGPGLFNNPYACCWNAAGDRLIVADTFKDRLVEVDVRQRAIVAVHALSIAPELEYESPPRLERATDAGELAHPHLAPGLNVTSTRAFGWNYRGDEDVDCTVSVPLPRFAFSCPEKFQTDWHPSLHGLTSVTNARVGVSTQGLFVDYPYRFVFARNFVVDQEVYLLLGSPQSKDLLVCGQGVTVIVPLQRDTWLVGNSLVGPDFILPTQRVVEQGVQRIRRLRALLLDERRPSEAIRKVLFPQLDEKEFWHIFTASMTSHEGEQFARACSVAHEGDEQRSAADRYLRGCRQMKTLCLPEIILAEMILCEGKAQPKLP